MLCWVLMEIFQNEWEENLRTCDCRSPLNAFRPRNELAPVQSIVNDRIAIGYTYIGFLNELRFQEQVHNPARQNHTIHSWYVMTYTPGVVVHSFRHSFYRSASFFSRELSLPFISVTVVYQCLQCLAQLMTRMILDPSLSLSWLAISSVRLPD